MHNVLDHYSSLSIQEPAIGKSQKVEAVP